MAAARQAMKRHSYKMALDAPISLQTSFSQMDRHPLTPDILEIVRVYEGARLAGGRELLAKGR